MRFRVKHLLWAMFLIAYFSTHCRVWWAIEQWASDRQWRRFEWHRPVVATVLLGPMGLAIAAVFLSKPPEEPKLHTWTPEQVD